ncbi:hypothetical protein P0Y35_01940 [Kiritimatiellaeota bacterium B1221]|nr:hypothetical protein [Kiritimatiellaeota bacterium B1221]
MTAKIKTLLLGSIALICFGCQSTPIPTGDRLVSVSWVNPTPVTLHAVETRIGKSHPPVKLETLPAYVEVARETNQPLYKSSMVKTKLFAGKTPIDVPSVYLEPPVRKSPEKEYNLRIQLRQGLPPIVSLEPIRLTRARLGQE